MSTHHKLVHEGGYSVQRDHSGELFFRRPDGKAVPHCGFHVGDHVDLGESETDQEVAEYLKNSCECAPGQACVRGKEAYEEISDWKSYIVDLAGGNPARRKSSQQPEPSVAWMRVNVAAKRTQGFCELCD